MDTIFKLDDAVKDFYKIFNDATQNSLAVKIEGNNGKSVMVISEDEYRSMNETLYLIKNPENYKNLLEAINSRKSINLYSLQALKSSI